MTCLAVILVGPPAQVAEAEDLMRKVSDGWTSVAPGVWVAGTALSARDLRDLLHRTGAKVLVLRVSGQWAASRMKEVGDWMEGACDYF